MLVQKFKFFKFFSSPIDSVLYILSCTSDYIYFNFVVDASLAFCFSFTERFFGYSLWQCNAYKVVFFNFQCYKAGYEVYTICYIQHQKFSNIASVSRSC